MANLDFEIVNYEFDATVFGKIQDQPIAEQLWPIVYIIHDDKTSEAYIGETTDVISRMGAHLKNDKKKKLTTVNLISSEKFNKSATLDIESNLIKYMAGDGKYSLINGNLGIAYHTYYQKTDVYWPLFTSIWDGLRSKGIANQSIETIDNSDLFKYSPYKSLRLDQIKSLKQMLVSLAGADHEAVIMEGGAGTGKTILAVFLFKLFASSASDFDFRTFGDEELEFVRLVELVKSKYPDLKMGLVVPMTSFRKTLKKVFSNVKGLKSSMVISPADVTKKEFDILLIDESHRLRQRKSTGAYIGSFDEASRRIGLIPTETNELEWILKQSHKAIFFYDAQQSIKPSDVPQVYFDELKKKKSTIVKQLTSQFRVLGGTDYVDFIGKLLRVELEPKERFMSSKYEFKVFDSLDDMVKEIKLKNEKVGLSRLIAGFS
jgi:predicted GIY-YIG superfamily endonuclease